MNTPILQTKLHIPPLSNPHLPRRHLITQLNEGLPRARLILLTAPAGYGKSTLLSQWLHQRPEPTPWLSLDPSDNEPYRFLRYLLAAVQNSSPDFDAAKFGAAKFGTAKFGAATADLLELPQGAPLDGILITFINELTTLDQPLLITLDDYHRISNDEIHDAVRFLLQHLPPAVTLILASRTEPPFSLGRLRATQQLLQLTATDLSLHQEETAAFLHTIAQLDLSDTQLATLQQQSEGWLAGLHLVTLALHSGRHTLPNTRHLFDFLAEEVLSQQPTAVQTFLKTTALLDSFCLKLADALLDKSTTAELAHIQQANLFLIPLDEQGEWFRYHHLFTDFLRSQLPLDERQAIFRQTAVWHQQHGRPEEAIPYALKADDPRLAADLITAIAPQALSQGQLMTVTSWLEQLPTTVTTFGLTILRGYIALLRGDLAQAINCATAAAEHDRDLTPTQSGYLLALQAGVASEQADTNEALELALEALEYLPTDDPFFYPSTMLVLGSIQSTLGEYRAARETQRRILTHNRQLNSTVIEMTASGNLAFLLYRQGKRRAAAAQCRQVLADYLNSERQPPPSAGFVYAVLGFTCLATNQLSEAKQYLHTAVDLCTKSGLNDFIQTSKSALVQLYLRQGELDKMWALLENLRQTAVHPYAKQAVDTLEARIQFQLGNKAAVRRWLTRYPPDPAAEIHPGRLSLYDLHLEWLIEQGELEPAEALLHKFGRFIEEKGLLSYMIRLRLLEAQLSLKRAQEQDASHSLERALQLATPEEIVVPFLSLPDKLRQMCAQFRPDYTVFIDQIVPERPFPSPTNASVSTPLVEDLSERELEVLHLIAQGHSNRGIANELVITVGTTKWHVHNILSKLGVKRRTQAVARARELGLI